MLMYVYSVFLILWEILCCVLLLDSFMKKRQYGNRMIPSGICAGLLAVDYFISCTLYEYLWVKQGAVILAISVAMYFIFQGRYLKILAYTILYQGLALMADYSVLLLFGKIFPSFSQDMQEGSGMSMLASLICKILLLCIILVLKRKSGCKSWDMLTGLEWFWILLVPVITIISLVATVMKFDALYQIHQEDILLYVALGMAGMNIMVFHFINEILDREAVVRSEKLFHEKVKNETQMYYAISENLDKQRKRAHEFKNHTACIMALANSGNYQELMDYVAKIEEELKSGMDMIDTNNVIINAILNTKYKEALDKEIVFVLKVNDLSGIWLPDTDIVVILSNLLNNAMEACIDCEKKVVKLKIVLEEDELMISVKNSFSKMPVKNKGVFVSGKEEPEEHGMGVMNVIEAVQRNHGIYTVSYEKKMFSFYILFSKHPNI